MGLLKKQGGKCPLCGKEIDLTVRGNKSDYVVDHDHNTGLIRGVLCRGCNGAIGRAQAAIAKWGKQGFNYDNIIPYMERMLEYYKRDPQPVIYPDHKTYEEKQAIKKQKRRRQQALRRAKEKMKNAG